jgi:spermidine synthase
MYEHTSPYHRIRVTDNDGVRLLKFERNQQSSMRLDDPFESDIEYVRYFNLALAIQPEIRRVLVVGLGGGSVVKQMWRDYPEMHFDAVEIDPEVADVAYELFGLPRDDRIRVIVSDGREFIRTHTDVYDLIIVDAFDDDRIPPHLLTEEFLRELRDHLTQDGVVAYNVIGSVHGDHSKPFRSFYRTLSNVWRDVRLFAVDYSASGPIILAFGGNIILLASDIELTADEMLARVAKRVDGRVALKGFGLLGKDLYRGQVRTGDVPLLTDPPNRRR